ncbi:MAG: sodium:calcium antiporter [Candidatus Eremiobacteraeota bacterium]|nr:sodium:calcium antiporter [Candidatus Eremiobacteraeota bacterium]
MIKKWFWILFFIALPFPWIYLKLTGLDEHSLLVAILSGTAIVSASFILSWIAEVAQKDIPQALAIAAVALIAVLPEYAVDMYFAWMAGKDLHYCPYALANMTGSNRLLIGAGWAFVMLIYYLKTRKKEIELTREHTLEISCLLIASLYALIIPLKGNLSPIDAVFFILLFCFYIYHATRCKVVEPEISGPQEALADLADTPRKLSLAALFLYAGFTIFISAAPFAESLIHTGKIYGIDEFILVQWVAPLASESPEFIVAALFAFNGHPTAGFGCLVSSKVNQWTLLVGMLPLVFAISAGHPGAMPLDARQSEEILLTTAQSLFAIAIILNLRFSIWEALILFVLFTTQLFIPHPFIRHIYSIAYLVLAILMVVLDRSKRESLKFFDPRVCGR